MRCRGSKSIHKFISFETLFNNLIHMYTIYEKINVLVNFGTLIIIKLYECYEPISKLSNSRGLFMSGKEIYNKM
jgi:hypothetical protein